MDTELVETILTEIQTLNRKFDELSQEVREILDVVQEQHGRLLIVEQWRDK